MQNNARRKHDLPLSPARLETGYMFLTMPNQLESKRDRAIR